MLALSSCQDSNTRITQYADYSEYLKVEDKETPVLESAVAFWTKKLAQDPVQYPYKQKLATLHMQLFERTGVIDHLIKAEELLTQVNEITKYSNVIAMHALSRNYIAQHRFKEALQLLIKAEKLGERLKDTQKMLFDVHLELGQLPEADSYLTQVRDLRDFDYLIRLSKWNDHKGDLETAILVMERALARAKEMRNTSLMQWSFTNLGDFYGHANRIEESYRAYLNALQLDPNDAYAKKGIAWIVYSHENDPEKAQEILQAISSANSTPDYLLLAAEIHDYSGEDEKKSELIKDFLTETSNPKYGSMYNSYIAILLAEEFQDYERSIEIAKTEIQNRSTAQSYDLLAWAHYKAGNDKKALAIARKYVEGNSEEPMVLYHLATIFKTNNLVEEARTIQTNLLESRYELGPMLAEEILKL